MTILLLNYQSDLIVEEGNDSYASIAQTLELIVEAEWNEKRGKLLICAAFVLYHCILIVLTLTIVSII
jgi:hypothetical protein